jgi:hypothetical protein
MTVQFSAIRPGQGEDCFCSNPLDEEYVAHDGLHSVHLKCLQAWAKRSSTCPTCRADIDLNSIFSSEEIRVLQRSRSYQPDPEGPNDAFFSIVDNLFVVPGSLLGTAVSMAATGHPETRSIITLGVLAGSVAGIALTRIVPLPSNGNGRLVMALSSSFITALTFTTGLTAYRVG